MSQSPDPSVSPADTIRRALNDFDGHDPRFVREHRHEQALDALAALLAVGERDKAEIEALKGSAWQELCARADAYLADCESLSAERERDGRRIARLTETLADLVEPFQWLCKRSPKLIREMPTAHAQAFKRASETLAAVLADEDSE